MIPDEFSGTVDTAIRLLVKYPERGPMDNEFFERLGPGNGPCPGKYERFRWYEDLLRRIQEVAPSVYPDIHKGTPFYFLGWLAFDLGNYQKALFYMDAALAEDQRDDRACWWDKPAARFLRLQEGRHVATGVVSEIRRRLDDQVKRFNRSTQTALTVDSLAACLAEHLLKKERERSALTAFYAFAYEFDDRLEELRLRPQVVVGGSDEPHLLHLFRGGLFFETLAKIAYPNCKDKTLGCVFKDDGFTKDFDSRDAVKGDGKKISEIAESARADRSQLGTFTVVHRLRNCTGHDLVRDPISADDYQLLVEREFDAIFHLVLKRFPA